MRKLPRLVYRVPWWWEDFITKLQREEIYAKGEKGDKGDPGMPITDYLKSIPPPGMRKINNFYVDKDGKLVVEYDDTIIP